MTNCIAIIAASVIAFGFKSSGYSVPPMILEKPRIAKITEALPAALLASLVILQTFSTGQHVVLDARAAGLGAAIAALIARVPFIGVVAIAAIAASLLRLAGWN